MADIVESSNVKKQETMEQHVDATADDSVNEKSNLVETTPSNSGAGNVEDSSVTKEIVFDADCKIDLNNSAIEPIPNEHADSIRMEEDDQDFLNDDFMENLDVVDSWVDTTDNIESPCNELIAKSDASSPTTNLDLHANLNIGTQEVDKSSRPTDEPNGMSCRPNADTKDDKIGLEKSVSLANQDKMPIDKDCKATEKSNTGTQEKKSGVKETTERDRDCKVKSPDCTDKREPESRRERSPNRSNKASDSSRRNTDRGSDRNTSLSSSTRRNSTVRPRRSRTKSRERDQHYNSRKNTSKERNPRRGGYHEQRTRRSIDSHSKRDRSLDRDKRSTGNEVTKPNTASTGRSRPTDSKKKNPLLDRLVPPGTEDDNSTKTDEITELTVRSPQVDTLVPPGTEEVQLPDLTAVVDRRNVSSTNKRRASNVDLDKSKSKPGTGQASAQNEKDRRGTEKRRRTDDTERKKHPLVPKKIRAEERVDSRERIVRDQDRISRELSLERLRESRISRELSLERLRESRNRDREERDRLLSRDRYRSQDKRSGSYERRPSHESRRTTRDHYDRRAGELSPVSPGCMSRGSPMSFEFSPVSSRSSSRERLRLEYQRSKFRSFSPISSGSDLSRSMVCISPHEERDPRGRRRRRLPFLDEMERKLGLKLTGGHNINQQLRASQQLPVQDFKIDVSAPPPGTYPVNYPPQVPYAAPFPQAMNPMYRAPSFTPIPPIATKPPMVRPAKPPPVVRMTKPPPVRPATPSILLNRQLVSYPREPENISFKFQRQADSQQTGGPKAPPPPAISAGGVARSEMSLSSILEASVKGTLETTKVSEAHRSFEVGGKNPVDESRVQRCQVAIQTLQEDESFSMITMGRFIVQACPTTTYSPVARFDHPAQETMFKLKSPLLRNQPVSLKFTTPPAATFKDKPAASEKTAPNVAVMTVKASIWPKNSEKKPPEKPVLPVLPDPVEDADDPDVFIVEKAQTVVSISSDSDHDMNLSPVSDASADERDDKLENVSSGEEDFNQCATCAERGREKKMVNSFTQSVGVKKRSVNVQVDFINEQLVGSVKVGGKRTRRTRRSLIDRSPGFEQSVHSDASSVSSCSSIEDTSTTPTNLGSVPTINQPRSLAGFNNTTSSSTIRSTAESFLLSVAAQKLVASNFQLTSSLSSASSVNQSSSNQSMSSNYKSFPITTNKFPNKSLQNNPPISYPNQLNTGNNTSNLDVSKALFQTQVNQSFATSQTLSSAGSSYKSSGPFQTGNPIKFTTLNSGTVLGVLSKPAPARGILKPTRSDDIHLSSVTSQPLPSAKDFQSNKFQESRPFQGGTLSQQQPYNSPASSSQTPSFQGGSTSRQQFVGNTTNLDQQGVGGQSFHGGGMLRQQFGASSNIQNKEVGEQPFLSRQPFFVTANTQSTKEIGERSFTGGRMFNQPFAGSSNVQTNQGISEQPFQSGNASRQPFVSNANILGNQGMGAPPFQSLGPQNMNTNFNNRFGSTGNVPTMVPPPTPVPAPPFNQQNFSRPSEGTGINASPAGLNPDNRQQAYFNTPSVGQQSNYYDRDRL